MLREGGRIFLECPNVLVPYGDLDEWFFEYAHVYSFSAATLTAVMRRAGFAPYRVQASGGLFVAAIAGDEDAEAMPDEPASLVVETLARYRTKLAEQVKTREATEVLATFLARTDEESGPLRTAIDALVMQSQRAIRGYTVSVESMAGICQLLDAEIDAAAEQWSSDPEARGFVAGRIAAMSQVSQMIGHVANAAKMQEVG